MLDILSCKIYTEEPAYRDNSFPKYKVLPMQEVSACSSDTPIARCLKYGRKHFINDELTQEVLNELAKQIRAGKVSSLLLSLMKMERKLFSLWILKTGGMRQAREGKDCFMSIFPLRF